MRNRLLFILVLLVLICLADSIVCSHPVLAKSSKDDWIISGLSQVPLKWIIKNDKHKRNALKLKITEPKAANSEGILDSDASVTAFYFTPRFLYDVPVEFNWVLEEGKQIVSRGIFKYSRSSDSSRWPSVEHSRYVLPVGLPKTLDQSGSVIEIIPTMNFGCFERSNTLRDFNVTVRVTAPSGRVLTKTKKADGQDFSCEFPTEFDGFEGYQNGLYKVRLSSSGRGYTFNSDQKFECVVRKDKTGRTQDLEFKSWD